MMPINNKNVLEYGIDIVDQCEFDLMNPFDIDLDIIEKNNSLEFDYNKFKIQAYKIWLEFTYRGESQVAVAYKYIYDNLRSGIYKNYTKNWSTDQSEEFYNFFKDTIAEETKHSVLWEHLVKKMYTDYEKFNINNIDYIAETHQLVDTVGLVKILIYFYIGETITLSTCSLLYQHSTNKLKKDFLEIFLREESKHLQGFSNFMANLLQQHDSSYTTLAQECYQDFAYWFEYFGLNNSVTDNNSLMVTPDVFSLIKNNNWQKKYNQFILNKNFLFYTIFHPNCNKDTFAAIINSRIQNMH
jgi:hypothetical protein